MAAWVRRVEALERRQSEQASADVLATAGIKTEPGKFIINGDLEVPNGKIKNDWLESPMEYGSARASEYGFAVSTTQTERGLSSVVVPDGYSRALITVFASLIVFNDTLSTQYVYLRAQARVVGTGAFQYSLRQQITLPSAFWGSLIVPMIFARDTPAGDTIEGMGLVYATAALGADPATVCDSELSVTFSR